MQYYYPGSFYPYQECYSGYYEPRGFRHLRNSGFNSRMSQGCSRDVDESVKKLIQFSKEQIAKEKQVPYRQIPKIEDKKGVTPMCHAPVNCETNRLSKHVVNILENIYQTSAFVNRKKREEIAEDLRLPIEKVRNWFQNRRGKDKRQTQVRSLKIRRPDIPIHKLHHDMYRGKDDVNESLSVVCNVTNVPKDDQVIDRVQNEPPTENVSGDVDPSEQSLHVYGTMPYWPASNWNNDDGSITLNNKSFEDSVRCSKDQVRYNVVFDAGSTKSYTVLKRSVVI